MVMQQWKHFINFDHFFIMPLNPLFPPPFILGRRTGVKLKGVGRSSDTLNKFRQLSN